MARPKNRQPSVKITITATPKLALYLDHLIQEEGYGASRGEVAKNLVWRIIEDLISKSIIEQRRGPLPPSQKNKRREAPGAR